MKTLLIMLLKDEGILGQYFTNFVPKYDFSPNLKYFLTSHKYRLNKTPINLGSKVQGHVCLQILFWMKTF